jgi:hypothetical protein
VNSFRVRPQPWSGRHVSLYVIPGGAHGRCAGRCYLFVHSACGVRGPRVGSFSAQRAPRYAAGAHEGVHRQVPRGFPVFSCRGGRCGPAVTAGVQPMLPAAGQPIRLRPGLTRRPSSACAAARPGPPAGHRTRRSGLPWRSRATVSCCGWCRRHGTPMTIHATGKQGRSGRSGGLRVFASRR